jgi:hypothetical protein
MRTLTVNSAGLVAAEKTKPRSPTLHSTDRERPNDLLIRRSAPMADAADRSWNYPNIYTGGTIGLGRFGFPGLRASRPLRRDLSFDLELAGAVERMPWSVFDRA